MDKLEFEKQFNNCFNALKRLVYYKTRTTIDGDDILQETLLSALKGFDKLKNPDSFKAWIFTIANNKCKDYYKEKTNQSVNIDEVSQEFLTLAKSDTVDLVNQTLSLLELKDRQILQLYYLYGYTQAEIAKKLTIPIGTVKSRLFNAKKSFSKSYPYPPKGEKTMKNLPKTLPPYVIQKSDKLPFEVNLKELVGWFIIPKLNNTEAFGFYDNPDKRYSGGYSLKVTGNVSVHGVSGVEIEAQYYNFDSKKAGKEDLQVFNVQQTDMHCRWLSETHYEEGIKKLSTFLDSDEFLKNWGFGEDNCGWEIRLKRKGTIVKEGNSVIAVDDVSLFDVAERVILTIEGKSYDCISVLDLHHNNIGIAVEHFIDENGRTVLSRHYNKDDWRMDSYKKSWSEMLPKSNTLIINGDIFVCWYECISTYIL